MGLETASDNVAHNIIITTLGGGVAQTAKYNCPGGGLVIFVNGQPMCRQLT